LSARLRAFARLGEGTFDLCVIGAGIVGSRAAYEASRDGLRVALVDAGDIGGATSSASSKLLHGGLRYFVQGHIGIARDGLREKHALRRDIVPGLVRSMPTLVSVQRRRWAGSLALRGALAAHDAVGGWRGPRSRVIDAAEAHRLVPDVPGDGPFFVFDQVQVDDGRLTLATALAAADRGAIVMNHARVRGIVWAAGEARVTVQGPEGDITVRAKAVLNASGPWVDVVRRMEDPRAAPIARLSKGVHLVLPVESPWNAALSVHVDDAHNLLAIPWNDALLVGITDTAFDGSPDRLAATDDDVDLMLQLAQLLLPAALVRRERIRAVSAGLRVLPLGMEPTAHARRDNVTDVSAQGMVSIAGGKLTTHRLEAMDALRLLPASVRPRQRAPSRETIVGVAPPIARSDVPAATLAYLAATYGDKLADVLASAANDPTALERIHPDGPDVWAQARYAIASELAMTVDDITDRRTSLRWRGLADEATRERIARMLLPRLVPS
jgi:glycerol-3-phosphate dehydrogenase